MATAAICARAGKSSSNAGDISIKEAIVLVH